MTSTHDEKKRGPRILVVAMEYPPGGYGVSYLSYQHVKHLAGIYRERFGYAPGEGVPIRVVAPLYRDQEAIPAPEISGVDVRYFRGRRTPILRLPQLFFHIARSAIPFRPDVIYCPQYRAAGPIVTILSFLLRAPYVAYFHGTEIQTELRNRLRRWIIAKYARRAAVTFTNSAYSRDLANSEMGPLDPPAEELNPPLDPAPFRAALAQREQIREQFGVRSGRSVVLSVCALRRIKGLDLALRGIERLRERRPELAARLDYWIVGGGGERARLVSQARAAGFAVAEGKGEYTVGESGDEGPRVRFVGARPPTELPAIYAGADIFLMPTRPHPWGGGESFGIVYLEAGAAGLPVIASRVGGVESAVVDGTTGLIISPENDDDIAEALCRFIEEEDFARQLGHQGRERVERDFAPRHLVGRLADALIKAARAR